MKKKPYATINDIPQASLDQVLGLLIQGDKQAADAALKALLAGVKDVLHYEANHLAQGLLAMANGAHDLLGYMVANEDGNVLRYYASQYKPNKNGLQAVSFVVRVLNFWARRNKLTHQQAEYVGGMEACEETIKANDVAFAGQYLELPLPNDARRLGYKQAYDMICYTGTRSVSRD